MSIVKKWALPAGGVKESDGTVEEMRLLFEKLPVELSEHIQQMFGADRLLQLNEIYLQLGQRPECIFTNDGGSITRQTILDEPCTNAHIDIFQKFFMPEDGSTQSSALMKRKGISGTLHRVSLITKPSAYPEKVLGVTVRVGRAMQGLIETMTGGNTFLQPLAQQRRSLLLIGKPGVGKTTALREIALMLSADPSLRVVVVDKSLEIAGDGDSPHSAIGSSRWMPVGRPGMQHEIMLEAVENQSPDVIIVDEISNAQEVRAAQTIAQRGVMLIATVHGMTLAELIDDRERSALVGGCSTVTLSGKEAERRSDKKKQVLKRTREPVFQAALELQSRSSWVFHNNVADVVDEYLDKEEGTALLLQPGQATQVMTFPGESQLEYCADCGILVPSDRCPKHAVHNENDGVPANQQNVGPFNVPGSKKKNYRSRNKKPQFAFSIQKN